MYTERFAGFRNDFYLRSAPAIALAVVELNNFFVLIFGKVRLLVSFSIGSLSPAGGSSFVDRLSLLVNVWSPVMIVRTPRYHSSAALCGMPAKFLPPLGEASDLYSSTAKSWHF